MPFPRIVIDLGKVEQNTTKLASICRAQGITIAGVVKACLGNIEVAKAMIKGGAGYIADSRLQNIERLRSLGVPLMMLRQPMINEIGRVIELTNICLVSEISIIRAMSATATSIRKEYKVIVMVETGDLREGVLPHELFEFIKEASSLPWIKVEGIGTNVACLQGVSPTPATLELLAESARNLRQSLGIEAPIVSGGNSSAWKLIEAGVVPPEINQFRFGEAILLGRETINLDSIPGTFQDAVTLEAEVIEVKEKPAGLGIKSLMGADVHTLEPTKKRAILALGVQDICRGELKPLNQEVKILRRSSDHLVIDVTDSESLCKVGDIMTFIPSYEAMVAAMTSPFVEKAFL